MSPAIDNGASPRRFVSSNGPHGILVIGSIPETGEPSVTVRMNATEIVGSLEASIALKDALEEVVTGITDAIFDDKPLPCDCGAMAPQLRECTVENGWRRMFYVECSQCRRSTKMMFGRTDAIVAWNEGDLEGCR